LLENQLASLNRMTKISEDNIIPSSLDGPEHCNNNLHEEKPWGKYIIQNPNPLLKAYDDLKAGRPRRVCLVG
jgi:hypothetical protein